MNDQKIKEILTPLLIELATTDCIDCRYLKVRCNEGDDCILLENVWHEISQLSALGKEATNCHSKRHNYHTFVPYLYNKPYNKKCYICEEPSALNVSYIYLCDCHAEDWHRWNEQDGRLYAASGHAKKGAWDILFGEFVEQVKNGSFCPNDFPLPSPTEEDKPMYYCTSPDWSETSCETECTGCPYRSIIPATKHAPSAPQEGLLTDGESRGWIPVSDGELNDYDAGLLNNYGGGNVEWWQGYLRYEINRCNEFWRIQVATQEE